MAPGFGCGGRIAAWSCQVIDDPDIYRAAKLIIDQHGADAGDFALKRIERLFDAGDGEGDTTWRLILAAIVELQRERQEDELRGEGMKHRPDDGVGQRAAGASAQARWDLDLR